MSTPSFAPSTWKSPRLPLRLEIRQKPKNFPKKYVQYHSNNFETVFPSTSASRRTMTPQRRLQQKREDFIVLFPFPVRSSPGLQPRFRTSNPTHFCHESQVLHRYSTFFKFRFNFKFLCVHFSKWRISLHRINISRFHFATFSFREKRRAA